MSNYGESYDVEKFCLLYGVEKSDIKSNEKISPTEFIFELTDGRRYLYDIIDDATVVLGHPELKHVSDYLWKKEFSRRLKKMACIRGFYLKDLAERVGVSENTMSGYATGKQIPNAYRMQRIADELSCSIEYLTNFDYLL